MIAFHYCVTAEQGIHARPAGALAKIAKKYSSELTMSCGQATCNVKSLVSLMLLAVRQGDRIILSAHGSDEEQAIAELKEYIQTYL